MRLLNTRTLDFEEFAVPPPHAILSHRWKGQEVSYEEYCSSTERSGLRWQKIISCCEAARSQNHDYVWIDSCCIDKRSSAELSEAINSMWTWYSKATECLAYLSDVHPSSLGREGVLSQLQSSSWFRRGWTLQELLAPRIVTFYNSRWQAIGQKSDDDLLPAISRVTRIPELCLIFPAMLHTKCIAQKFSWAAYRFTTRPEDMAYCLLGLMGVNMPLLYGEGDKAFLRLQQEIVKQSDDESIFAWRYISPPRGLMSGILAAEVHQFAASGTVELLQEERLPYAVTNKGLELRSRAVYVPEAEVFILPLNCSYSLELGAGPAKGEQCSIAIRKDNNAYFRVFTSRLGVQPEKTVFHTSTRIPEPAPYYIRLSRWDHGYQPAFATLQKAIDRWAARKRGSRVEQDALRMTWTSVQQRCAPGEHGMEARQAMATPLWTRDLQRQPQAPAHVKMKTKTKTKTEQDT